MIGLIDCNNFFVSCERLFRPDLLKKPVLVLSSNDGCVISRSQEVKDLGIPMGIPYFEIRDVCTKEGITVFSSNFKLYRDISTRVMLSVREVCSEVEVYSVDEAFFVLPETCTYADLVKIRSVVMQYTGIPVSIGAAPTKTLAKIANGIAKKGHLGMLRSVQGVFILDLNEWNLLKESFPCSSVWGIGRSTAEILNKFKIATVSDLLRMDVGWIRNQFGVVGERLLFELSGKSVYSVGDGHTEKQETYTSTRSFGKNVFEKDVVMSALAYHIAHVAEKLRSDKRVGKRLTILTLSGKYGPRFEPDSSQSIELESHTSDTFVLLNAVRKLLDRSFQAGFPYKKAGVIVSDIMDEGRHTDSIFAELQSLRDVCDITDTLNTRFGKNSVRLGSIYNQKEWADRHEKLSPQYTTSWREIAIVKAV